jgi:hypothetical protein
LEIYFIYETLSKNFVWYSEANCKTAMSKKGYHVHLILVTSGLRKSTPLTAERSINYQQNRDDDIRIYFVYNTVCRQPNNDDRKNGSQKWGGGGGRGKKAQFHISTYIIVKETPGKTNYNTLLTEISNKVKHNNNITQRIIKTHSLLGL